jgi:hypothetical protein
MEHNWKMRPQSSVMFEMGLHIQTGLSYSLVLPVMKGMILAKLLNPSKLYCLLSVKQE